MNVYILLDASGSMISLWNEAISSINGYVKTLKKDDYVHLASFNSLDYKILRDMPVEYWLDLQEKNSPTVSLTPEGTPVEEIVVEVIPEGTTPLYDSCGKIMLQAEEDGAEKTILVVMTDGAENASQEYTKEMITQKIKDWENNRKWEVVFLGANFDAVDTVATDLGVSGNKTLNYGIGNFARGMSILSNSTAAYSTTGQAISFSAEDKTTAKGN